MVGSPIQLVIGTIPSGVFPPVDIRYARPVPRPTVYPCVARLVVLKDMQNLRIIMIPSDKIYFSSHGITRQLGCVASFHAAVGAATAKVSTRREWRHLRPRSARHRRCHDASCGRSSDGDDRSCRTQSTHINTFLAIGLSTARRFKRVRRPLIDKQPVIYNVNIYPTLTGSTCPPAPRTAKPPRPSVLIGDVSPPHAHRRAVIFLGLMMSFLRYVASPLQAAQE